MASRIPLLISGIFLLLTIAGCAGPKTIDTQEKPWETQADRTPIQSPQAIVPAYPKASESLAPAVQGNRSITLVLGGAGVASFATVGLLKRLQEEKITIDSVVTTGWPTLFVLARGFLSTLHEVEWFATRLTEKDFYKTSLFESGYASHENLGKLIEGAFRQKEIQESRLRIIISAANTEFGEAEIFDRGDWREPLLKTMSVPGLFRPYPAGADRQSILSLQGLDVEEAKRRGATTVVAVYMYDDYLREIASGKKNAEVLFRRLYQAQLRKSLGAQLRLAQITAKIELFKAPNDFSMKRAAILAGYQEGERIAREFRALRD